MDVIRLPHASYFLHVLVALSCGLRVADDQSIDPQVEIRTLMFEVQDIKALSFLNPIKLSASQIDKLIPTISLAQKRYNTKLAGASAAPVQRIAQEIKETKAAMLAGAAIPEEFDAKVKRIQERWKQQRDKEDLTALKSLTIAVKSILTKKQFALAAQLARKLEPKTKSGSTADGEVKLFNLYVLKVIIQYPRIVPLLAEIKKTRETEANSNHANSYPLPMTVRGGIVQSTLVLKSIRCR